jgi:D-inositol-3-phosphate glycosyltransferase
MISKTAMKATTIIITHYGAGGSLHYLRQLVNAFRKTNYPVRFYCPENTDIPAEDNSVCGYFLKDPSTYPRFLKIRFLKYIFHLSKYVYNALIIRPESHIKIAHLLFPFYLTDWLIIDRLKKRGLKIVLTVHNVFPHNPFLGGKLDWKLSRRIYRKADLLLVHTDSLKDKLADMYSISPNKIQVVPHGFFAISESPAERTALKKKYCIPLDKKVLLFFGTIRGNKGLDILLHAMPELEPEYFLLIAGESEGAAETPVDYYEKMIADTGIHNTVCWVKRYILDKEISEVFKIADAIILPYKKSFYGQSGVLNLAVGYETPSVVSDVGGIGETVKKYNIGVVIRPEDTGALRQGILSLFEKLDKKADFNFAKYKSENNWGCVAEKLVSVYKNLQ